MMNSLVESNIDLDRIFKSLDNFFKSDLRNCYISDEIIKIYIRKSKRLYKDKMYDCFDLATIEVEESQRNKGYFTKFLSRLIEDYPFINIFVESILNDRLPKKLKQFGFEEQRLNSFQLNMFLIRS